MESHIPKHRLGRVLDNYCTLHLEEFRRTCAEEIIPQDAVGIEMHFKLHLQNLLYVLMCFQNIFPLHN